MRESSGERVNWGSELLRVLGIIGGVVFRILSYFLNILLTLLLIGMITGIIVASVFAIYVNNHLDLEIDPAIISTVNRDSSTRIYYMSYETEDDRINRDGTAVELRDQRLTGSDSSIAVSFSQIPADLYHAFIAIEDHRFEEHNGVDWWTTAQAVAKFTGLVSGSGGGSTITQQLIKNSTGEDEVTIQRKVEEIFRAINLEKVKSKQEIFEAYANIVYFGNHCDGVQAAANYYFGKDVSELDLVECAALAAIVKNPSQFEPMYHDKDRLVFDADGNPVLDEDGEQKIIRGNEYRRWTVLEQMKEYGYITEAQCLEAQNTELQVMSYDDLEDEEDVAEEGITIFTWYTESLLSQLQEDLVEKYGVSLRTASQMIYNNGYKIYIPMDPEVQGVLEEVYVNDKEYFPSTGSGLQPQSAMVVCDPYTGDVLGLVGGRGQKIINRGTNRASVAVRPPGSSIKPLSVYAPALDAGLITYGSVIDDSPVWFNRTQTAAATEWSAAQYSYVPYPQNYPNVYRGLTTIHEAVTQSINTVAMKVLMKYGVDRSFDFMKNQLHFDSLIDSMTLSNGQIISDRGEAALALGQPNYGVTLLEMVSGYCMFENYGMYNEPNLYLRVEDADGNVVFDRGSNPQIVISEETASIMTIMMQEVMSRGTGTACTLRETVDVAGKTGTTSADFDRYFVGFTPYYVGGVWTGYDMPQSLSDFTQNPSLTVWDTVMTMLHQKYIDEAEAGGEPLKKFQISPGVVTATYCKDSGMLENPDTCHLDPRTGSGSRIELGYFTRETMPKEKCTTHVLVRYDWGNGGDNIGGVAYPDSYCESTGWVALIREENRSFPAQVVITDAQYTYRELPKWVQPAYSSMSPFYVNLLGQGEYVGVSSWSYAPFNRYCTYHAKYTWYPEPTAETEAPEDGASDAPDDIFNDW